MGESFADLNDASFSARQARICWSYDFVSGLQIVPGVAFPVGFRANDGQRGVFLYLSFEHELPGLPK